MTEKKTAATNWINTAPGLGFVGTQILPNKWKRFAKAANIYVCKSHRKKQERRALSTDSSEANSKPNSREPSALHQKETIRI